LDKVQGSVKAKLGAVSKASDQLKQGLQMLGVVVGQLDPAVAVNQGPTLKQVVDQNAAYEQKSGYQLAAPAAPANGTTAPANNTPTGPTAMNPVPSGSLAEAVQKYNDANKATPIQVTAPPAGTADKGGNVTGAIKSAGDAVKTIDTDIQTVNAATTAKTPVTADKLTNFATAGTGVSSMQLTQSAQIDTIKTTLPDPASIPQAGGN
jgi:hypothetical protein